MPPSLKTMLKINLLTGHVFPSGRRIPLTLGQFTVVDEEDFDRLNQWKWYAVWRIGPKSFYAERSMPRVNGKRPHQLLHREVLGLEKGDPDVDHMNHDTLDNRKSNLQLVDHRGNAENQRNQSRFGAGVRKRGNRFEAFSRVCLRYKHIGSFGTAEEARKARETFLHSLPSQ